jgi:hypothetical protein
MPRFTRIESIEFASQPLPLPLSVQLSRHAEPIAGIADGDLLPSAIQLSHAAITIEARIRSCQIAEELSLGQQGRLQLTTRSADGQTLRQLTVDNAVLTSIQIQYEQNSPASAVLKFTAYCCGNEPFGAEEIQ